MTPVEHSPLNSFEQHASLLRQRPQVLLGQGPIWHERLQPRRNAFSYGAYYLMLPMRTLRATRLGLPCAQPVSGLKDQPLQTPAVPCADQGLAMNRWAALSFYDRDHGEGGDDALAWLESILKSHGVQGVDGEIWLQTFPRVFGYTFKPVSFWYAYSQSGQLKAVVAEVNNTFGQRHCYLLVGDELLHGQVIVTNKVFHVSPFCEVAGQYCFAFKQNGDWQSVQVDLHTHSGALVRTRWRGMLQAYTPHRARRLMWQYPLMTFGIMIKIHWQAVKLWFKRVPFFSLPNQPEELVSK